MKELTGNSAGLPLIIRFASALLFTLIANMLFAMMAWNAKPSE